MIHLARARHLSVAPLAHARPTASAIAAPQPFPSRRSLPSPRARSPQPAREARNRNRAPRNRYPHVVLSA